MSSISEAVKNHDDTKIFRPADYDDFMRWLDYADTEEKLFSRLGYWMVMQGLPDDRNQKYDMVRERAQELKLWNGLELKLRRWMDNSAEEFKRLGEKAYTALIGQDYASYKNNAPSEPVKALAPLCLKDIHALVSYGKWEAVEAAHAAPAVVFALTTGLLISFWISCPANE